MRRRSDSVRARWCLATGALAVGLMLVGCGDRLGLPDEPNNEGIPLGEIAYVVQYRWENLATITGVTLASGILYVIEDNQRVVAYFADKANPTLNSGVSFPDSIVDANGMLVEQPVEIATGAGSTIWVAFLQPDTRLLEFQIGSPPTASGRWIAGDAILELGGMTVDPDSGYVYVADAQAHTVSKYAADASGGRRVAVLSTEGRGDRFVLEPRGLFFYSDSILVADRMNNRVQVIHADKPLTGRGEVLDPNSGEPIGLRKPVDVWVDRAGMFYVAEDGRVTQITPAGEIKEIVTELDPSSASAPPSLTANTTQVWVPDPIQGRLTVYQINTVAEELP